MLSELFAVDVRLVATHYPHHCLVSDWLNEELSRGGASAGSPSLHAASCSVSDLSRGYLLFCFVVFAHSRSVVNSEKTGRVLPILQSLLLLHSFNSLFSRTTWVSRYQKSESVWI